MDGTAPPVGRRGKQLRAAVETARERRPAPHGHESDPELLALVEEPYTGVDETHRRLHELLDALEARGDRRAVFLEIYTRMTGAVARAIEAGRFDDPEWVGEYLVEFANLYRRAVRDFERGDLAALPDPWQLAFDAAERGDSLVVQDAALGVNAHINYDLALALADVGVDPDRPAKYRDHATVTDVIRGLVDEAQAGLAERDAAGLATVDESLGTLDERVTVFTIDECRDSAWRTACAMDSRFRLRRRLAHWINDVTSTGAAYLILSSRVNGTVHATLDDLESTFGDD